MAAIALIKFTQGLVVGDPGVALAGDADVEVVIENDTITDIQSWKIDLLYAPPGGLVVAGTLATGNSSTPSASFTPSATPGSYRVLLTVYTGPDLSGSSNRDIRVFAVPDTNGFIFPPYQQLPPKLPVLGSGLPGEKPDEMNFGNQPYGWDGAGDDGLMLEFMRRVAQNFGGGTARDSRFWDPSNDDGTYTGTQPILNGTAFTAVVNRQNLWAADSSDYVVTMPALGVGDHNKIVAFREAGLGNQGSVGSLIVTPQGATTINFGNQSGLASLRVTGLGSLHVFRYDEGFDKFWYEDGAHALSGRELRNVLGVFKPSVDNCGLEVPNAITDDVDVVVSGDFNRAIYVIIQADVNFAVLTGIDASGRDNPDFCPIKWCRVVGSKILLIDSNVDGAASAAENKFTGIAVNSLALSPGDWFLLHYIHDLNLWGIINAPDTSSLRVTRSPTVDGEGSDIGFGEILRVDLSGSDDPVTINMPSSPYPGARVTVIRIDDNDTAILSIDGVGENLQDPVTFGSGSPTPVPASSQADWIYDETVPIWRLWPFVPIAAPPP